MRLLEIADNNFQAELNAFADATKAKHGLKQFWLYYDARHNVIDLSAITVDKSDQRQGAGTSAMNDLTDFADEHGLTIVLVPGVRDTGHGTTSRGRLVKFYKRFGFRENKGRSMDFAIGGGKMIRDPQ